MHPQQETYAFAKTTEMNEQKFRFEYSKEAKNFIFRFIPHSSNNHLCAGTM